MENGQAVQIGITLRLLFLILLKSERKGGGLIQVVWGWHGWAEPLSAEIFHYSDYYHESEVRLGSRLEHF